MAGISVGSVSVSVVPDASKFAQDMRTKLANLPAVQVAVEANTTAARAAIDALAQNHTATINVAADTAAAAAAIAAAAQNQSATISVDADTAAATAQIAAASQNHTAAINVNADTAAAMAQIALAAQNHSATINVNANTAGAAAQITAVGAAASSSSGGVNALLVAGAALGPAIIPVAGAVAAALAAIGPAALAGVAGIGTMALGFSGVGAAVKALGAQNDGAAAAATKSAASQVSAAEAVRDAQRGVADATRAAAAGVTSALQGQEQAERSLSQAQTSQRQAQLDLTQARADAKTALEDLAFQVQDGELSQRQANLGVSQAQMNLWQVQADPKATELQRQQAQLAYDQAVQNLNEITVKNQRLKAEKKAADKAGVDGSKQVTDAQQKLNDATQATVDAQKAVKDAYAATAEARRAGAERVTVAEERLATAVRSAAAGAATATAATTALNKAMGDLSPAGQRFARFIFGLRGAFDQLKASAQENLLPGVEAGIRSMLPLLPILNTIVSNAASAMGELFREAGKALTAPFWKSFFKFIADTVGPNLKAFGDILGNMAQGFAGLVIAFGPVATQVLGGVVSLSKAFADWATHLGTNGAFQSFLAYIRDVGPKVAKTVWDLVLATIPLFKALAPLGGVLIVVIDAFAKFIAQQSPLVALGIVVGGIAAGLAIFGAAASGIVLAVVGLVAGLVYAYQHFDGFRNIVDTVATTVKKTWDEKIFPALQSFWRFIVDKLVPALVHFWQDTVVPAFRAIVAAVQYAWTNYLQPILGALWNFVLQVLVPAVVHLWKDVMVPAWAAIQKAVVAAWKFIQPVLKVLDSFLRNILIPIIRTLINDVAVPLFKLLGTTIKVMWETVVWPALKALGDAIGWLWKTIIKPTLVFIVDAFVTMAGGILDAAAGAFGWIPGIGPKLQAAKEHFDTFAKDVTGALNGIDGQDVEVGVKFKAGDSVALHGVKNKINAGGGGANPALRAAGGPIFGPGTGTSDSIPAMLSNGEHVLTAKEVEAAGGHAAIYAFRKQLRGFATGGAVTVGTSIPSTASMGSAVDLGFLQFFSDNMKKITDGLVQPFDGSKGAAQWANLVQRVLTELHQPLSDMAAVLRRIDFESGGNPNAINLTDQNAIDGHPSQGLMQTVPGTFATWAGPYRSRGITDPLASIYAGVNYALHEYGPLKNIDPLNRPKGYDAGGWLQPGLTTVFNGTQKPEAVFTHEQFQSIKDGGLSGKGGPSVNYNGPVYVVDPEQIGRQNVNAMRDAIAVENLTGAL